MKEKFQSIIQRIKETGISKKLLNAKSIEDLKQAINGFEDENKDIIFAISDWDKEYDYDEEGYMISEGEDIQNPIELSLFIYYLPCSTEDDIVEDEREFIDSLNSFDSKVAKAVAKYMYGHYLYEISFSDIEKYMK